MLVRLQFYDDEFCWLRYFQFKLNEAYPFFSTHDNWAGNVYQSMLVICVKWNFILRRTIVAVHDYGSRALEHIHMIMIVSCFCFEFTHIYIYLYVLHSPTFMWWYFMFDSNNRCIHTLALTRLQTKV